MRESPMFIAGFHVIVAVVRFVIGGMGRVLVLCIFVLWDCFSLSSAQNAYTSSTG